MEAYAVYFAALSEGLSFSHSEGQDGPQLIVNAPEEWTDPRRLMPLIKEHKAAILDYLQTRHLGALTPPDKKGIPFEQWHTHQLMQQAAAHRRALKETEK